MKIPYNYVNTTREELLSCGVYTITHLSKPNLFYVGSTAGISKNRGFLDRWRRHYSDLKKNKHCNEKLQKAVNKYGIEGIRFEIIEITSPELAVKLEQYWINMLQPYYNIVKNASNTLGFKQSEKYLLSIRKPILQYDLEGNFIKEWKWVGEIQNFYNKKGSISQCCKHKSGSSLGYQWRYKEDNAKVEKYEKSTSYKVITYDINGNFISTYNSILEASKSLNIPVGNITKHLQGKYNQCYGYIFKRYLKNFPKVISPYICKHKYQKRIKITNLITNEIKYFNSYRDASRSGYNRHNLTKIINSGGYYKEILIELI